MTLRPRRTTLAFTAATLAYGLVAQRRTSRRGEVALAIGAGASALAAARWVGLDAGDLGLNARAARRGARSGLATALPIAALIGAAAVVPRTRSAFVDERAHVPDAEVAYHLFVRIPIATALTEEVLFRAVLLAVASAWLGAPLGLVYSSAVFGVWHVLPALEAHDHSPAHAAVADRLGGRHVTVAGTVVTTLAAGVALGMLRRRSGSVLAPVIVHGVVNGVAFALARTTAPSR